MQHFRTQFDVNTCPQVSKTQPPDLQSELSKIADARRVLVRLMSKYKDDDRKAVAMQICARIVRSIWAANISNSYPSAILRAAPATPYSVFLCSALTELADQIGDCAAKLPHDQATFEIGLTYTALLAKKEQAASGMYFTHPALAVHLINVAARNGVNWLTARILEPACGGGGLILEIAQRILNEVSDQSNAQILSHLSRRLVGYEIDPFAAWLAQVAMDAILCRHCDSGQMPPTLIRICNTLDQSAEPEFDAVIANPPFGKTKLSVTNKNKFSRGLHGHANMYALFLDHAVSQLRVNGRVIFITPSSFLSGAYFQNLRRTLRTEVRPKTIDFVGKRRGVFQRVQQDFVVSCFARNDTQASPTVGTVEINDAGKITASPLGEFRLPAALKAPWILPRTRDQVMLAKALSEDVHHLEDWGYGVSTGPVIWNRNKHRLSKSGGSLKVPLIWAEAIKTDGTFQWKADRKKGLSWFLTAAGEENLSCTRPCVLVQRTTSTDQAKRLVAAVLPDAFLKKHVAVVIENHINMLRQICKQPAANLETLAAFLNSAAADQAFRCLGGSTAVSASELRCLPLPAPERLSKLSQLVECNAARSEIEQECWRLVLNRKI